MARPPNDPQDEMSKPTLVDIRAYSAKMEKWNEREWNETLAACGDWAVEPIGLDVLGELMDHERRFAAIHEAGHVVACTVLGFTPSRVTIESNEYADASTTPPDEDDMSEDELCSMVVSYFAGECAALLAGCDAGSASSHAAHLGSDQQKAAFGIYFFRGIEGERVPLLRDRVQNLRDRRDEIEAILRDCWSKVGLVARFLLKDTTLDNDDLINLLDPNDDHEAEEAFEDGRAMKAFLSDPNIGDLTPEQRAAIHRHRERCKEGGPLLRRALERLNDKGPGG